MKQYLQQHFNTIPTADVLSTEATVRQPRQTTSRNGNKFAGNLNAMIDEFNREFSSSRDENINNNSQQQLQQQQSFYKTGQQQRKNEQLLEKAHDIINHVRTDLQVDKVAQTITSRQKSRSGTPTDTRQYNNNNNINNNSINNNSICNINSSILDNCNNPQIYNLNQSQLGYKRECYCGSRKSILEQEFRRRSIECGCTNSILDNSDFRSIGEWQEKLCISNKNLSSSVCELQQAHKTIKNLQDEQLQLKENLQMHQQQYQSIKQQLKITLIKLKQAKDRENYLKNTSSADPQFQSPSSMAILQKQNEELKSRLADTLKQNEELFTNYSNTLKVNSQLQSKVLEQEQENSITAGQLQQYRGQIGILKQTQYKVDVLENNLNRIEDNRDNFELQKMIKQLNEESNQKNEVIGYCCQYLQNQMKYALTNINKILDSSNSSNKVANSNQIKCKKQLKLVELVEAGEVAKLPELKILINQMDYSNELGQLLQGIGNITIELVNEIIIQRLNPILSTIDRKLLIIENIIPTIKQLLIKQKSSSQSIQQNCSVSIAQPMPISNTNTNTYVHPSLSSRNGYESRSGYESNNPNKSFDNNCFPMTTFSKQQTNNGQNLFNRQSLSFKKQQFHEFDQFESQNINNSHHNEEEERKDSTERLIDDSSSTMSHNLFKFQSSPQQGRGQEEQMNLRISQVIIDGIRKFDEIMERIEKMQDRFEETYQKIARKDSLDFVAKAELLNQQEGVSCLAKSIQLIDLFIKKELGIVKAEIDYQLKIQKQMDLPKRFEAK